MKVIIGVVIFVFTVISGLQALERKNAAYYQSLNESLKQSQDSYFKEEEVYDSSGRFFRKCDWNGGWLFRRYRLWSF